MLKLYFLGPPQLIVAGQSRDLGRRKALALLAYLTLTARPQPRDVLADLLNPERPQHRARSSLRRDMSYLNKTLGLDVLCAGMGIIDLNPKLDIWCDVRQFETALAACQTAQMAGQPPSDAQLALLSEAVTLYRDDFLHGFCLPDSPGFEAWQRQQALTLQRTLIQGLSYLSRWQARCGNYLAAIDYVRRWVRIDPLQERAHFELMQLYIRLGDRIAALNQYEMLAEILEAEMGISPAAQITALYHRLRAGDMVTPGPEALPSVGLTLPTPKPDPSEQTANLPGVCG